MDAKHLLPKTYALYSSGKLTKEQLPDVALEEALDRYQKPHGARLFFLRTMKWGARVFGYSLTGIVGASTLVPVFLSIAPMASNAPAYVKWLYGVSFASGAGGLGLISYYIGSTTHRIAKAISKKIELWEYIKKTDPETAVRLFMQKIEQ
ncbi:MAG: hypothetical protein ACPL06_03590 [Candidatus Anstonellales archaeon]